jgi:hypothetical protein
MKECNPKAVGTAITENLQVVAKHSVEAVMVFRADAGHIVVTRRRMA